MRVRGAGWLALSLGLGLVLTAPAGAKGKPKVPLSYLQARTATVLIDPDAGVRMDDPQPQIEAGSVEDSFTVYEGGLVFEDGLERPLQTAPGWRQVAKDALKPHGVPAVDEFRKALDEADKAAAAKKP